MEQCGSTVLRWFNLPRETRDFQRREHFTYTSSISRSLRGKEVGERTLWLKELLHKWEQRWIYWKAMKLHFGGSSFVRVPSKILDWSWYLEYCILLLWKGPLNCIKLRLHKIWIKLDSKIFLGVIRERSHLPNPGTCSDSTWMDSVIPALLHKDNKRMGCRWLNPQATWKENSVELSLQTSTQQTTKGRLSFLIAMPSYLY